MGERMEGDLERRPTGGEGLLVGVQGLLQKLNRLGTRLAGRKIWAAHLGLLEEDIAKLGSLKGRAGQRQRM